MADAVDPVLKSDDELAEAQRSVKFWRELAEFWEREHNNVVLPYTTKVENERDKLRARLAAVLAVCNRYDPGLFPLAQVRAAAQGAQPDQSGG